MSLCEFSREFFAVMSIIQDGSAPAAGRVEHAEALLGTQAPQGGDDVHRHVLVSTLCQGHLAGCRSALRWHPSLAAGCPGVYGKDREFRFLPGARAEERRGELPVSSLCARRRATGSPGG